MLGVFVSVVLPVFLMAGVGAILARLKQISPTPISAVTLYIFSPALILHSLSNTTLATEDLGRITLFSFILAAVLYVIGLLGAKVSGIGRSGRSAFLLGTLFMNAGNYGLPVALFAFGQAGLDIAIVFLVGQATLSGTLAIYVASASNLTPAAAIRVVARMPMLYATVLGIALNLSGLEIPEFLARPTELLGDAAVPSMLMVLGIELSNRFALEAPKALILVAIIRLIFSAVLAYLISIPLGITGLTQDVLIVLSAMPTAVFTIILASEFDARPTFVTSVVVVTTILSLATVAPLITLVQGQ